MHNVYLRTWSALTASVNSYSNTFTLHVLLVYGDRSRADHEIATLCNPTPVTMVRDINKSGHWPGQRSLFGTEEEEETEQKQYVFLR